MNGMLMLVFLILQYKKLLFRERNGSKGHTHLLQMQEHTMLTSNMNIITPIMSLDVFL
jgi:hypothetical protein